MYLIHLKFSSVILKLPDLELSEVFATHQRAFRFFISTFFFTNLTVVSRILIQAKYYEGHKSKVNKV